MTGDRLGLAEELAEETRRGIAKKDLTAALALVVDLAVGAGLADMAGVAQRLPGGALETTAPTNELVTTADKLQYELHEGPCVDASYTAEILFSEDVSVDRRWPRWGPQAAALGIGSIMSVQLYIDAEALGALNLYSLGTRTYSPAVMETARLVGTHASIALAHFRGTEHLLKAIDARHMVGMAQGIVMERYKLGSEQAFAFLQRVSQQTNQKLHLIASEIVRTGKIPT